MSTITNEKEKPTENIPFMDAYLYWLKQGFISFGGPTGRIGMMHQD